jgi:hypothetical protein
MQCQVTYVVESASYVKIMSSRFEEQHRRAWIVSYGNRLSGLTCTELLLDRVLYKDGHEGKSKFAPRNELLLLRLLVYYGMSAECQNSEASNDSRC